MNAFPGNASAVIYIEFQQTIEVTWAILHYY